MPFPIAFELYYHLGESSFLINPAQFSLANLHKMLFHHMGHCLFINYFLTPMLCAALSKHDHGLTDISGLLGRYNNKLITQTNIQLLALITAMKNMTK